MGLQMRQFIVRLVTPGLGAAEGLLSVGLRSFVTRIGERLGEAGVRQRFRRTLIENK